MAAEPFRSMYLQMCPQALVEVWAGALTLEEMPEKMRHVHWSSFKADIHFVDKSGKRFYCRK